MPQAEFDFALREFPTQYVALHTEPLRYPSFNRLMEICPALSSLKWRAMRGTIKNPYPLNDRMFLALAACFASREKREILRALILDVLGDDLAALLDSAPTEGF